MKPPLRLVVDGPTGLAALEPAVSNAAANGHDQIAIDLDRLVNLEIPEVRALIRLRRIAHDRGARVALQVGSPDHRRALCELGLDRLFPLLP
ncbi:MAG TPA: hypothetical protein VGX96_16120 [Candidatus Elarobacter sp.]|jgi:hypothetical protein|nr:hypothetical protein [Candidatus Elarobacter sp.]